MDSIATNVTVDLKNLECTICLEPLKPPVYQCAVGHVVCSTCRQKLRRSNKCHVCKGATVFNRCFVVEQIVQSIQLSCSNSQYGCAAKMAYHEKEEHEMKCPHAPCFCPEAGCGFAGSTAALVAHLTGRHWWQCNEFPEFKKAWHLMNVDVQEGMRILHCKRGPLFLVRFEAMGPLGSPASIFCVDPHLAEPKFKCRLRDFWPAIGHKMVSDFWITSTDLSQGFPTNCHRFVVPKASHPPAKISFSIENGI